MKALFAFAITAALSGATVNFSSQGTTADPGEINSLGPTLAIAQHPAWAPPLAGSSWVSYGITGNPASPGYFAPANGTVVSFYEVLYLPWLPSAAQITIRADDSTAFYVNGSFVQPEAPTAGNTYTTCSNFPVGCLVSTQVTLNIASVLQQGPNILQFDVAQRQGSSFGLNYAGFVDGEPRPTPERTPEPATFGLIGLALITFGVFRRR